VDVTVSLVTCGSRDEGERIARTLVEDKLAACVNVVPGVTSFYFWDGKLNRDEEVLLVIKSVDRRSEDLARRVREIHSYSVPEVVTLEVAGGSGAYLDWVRGEVP